jgi:hypothetical protein
MASLACEIALPPQPDETLTLAALAAMSRYFCANGDEVQPCAFLGVFLNQSSDISAPKEMRSSLECCVFLPCVCHHSTGGLWQRALQIFNSMDAIGVERDIITYCATISVISWSKRWELAVEVSKE